MRPFYGMIGIALLLATGQTRGQEPRVAPGATCKVVHPRGYAAVFAAQAPKIDGKLDDPAWQQATWTEDFGDIQGEARPAPRFRTRAKMTWDDQYFYVAARLEEPHVWGTLTKHDSVIFQDNDFEIFIDPDGDNQQYLELEINALNTEWDLRLGKAYRDGGPALNEWEVPGLKTAVAVEGTLNDPTDQDTAWTVEWAIPWKVLAEFAGRACPPRSGDMWRVNFSRVEWRHTIDKDGKYKKIPGWQSTSNGFSITRNGSIRPSSAALAVTTAPASSAGPAARITPLRSRPGPCPARPSLCRHRATDPGKPT